jgi:hypothetical protein
MKYFDFDTLDKPKLEQPAFDFGRRLAMDVFADLNRVDASSESAIGLAQGYAGCR